ncbi:MAG TPA: hypothetical protein VK473_01025 [Terriglobales bacterium]|nr:hypothetical protein [Terriglobales bacterium]
MITRDEIRELAAFQSAQGDAVSFYYQPTTPADKSHRQEALRIKELVKNAIREAEKSGKNGKQLKAALERMLAWAENLHGNQGRAKAAFACGSSGLWKEFDLPPLLPGTVLHVNTRFHLRPLAAMQDALCTVYIALVERSRARLFQMQEGEIREREDFIAALSRRGRSDGFLGYDAGHADRRVENEALSHLKRVADRLLELHQKRGCEQVIFGCREDVWPSMERQLHPYLRERLVGRFDVDVVSATAEQVRERARKMLNACRDRRRRELVAEVLDEARARRHGAVGLRRVLRSMEQGEVQTLLMESSFAAPGVYCSNCGHIDMHLVKGCSVCGRETHEIDDISDALVGLALRNGVEIVYVPHDADLQKAGNIAARLRFRAERRVESVAS